MFWSQGHCGVEGPSLEPSWHHLLTCKVGVKFLSPWSAVKTTMATADLVPLAPKGEAGGKALSQERGDMGESRRLGGVCP